MSTPSCAQSFAAGLWAGAGNPLAFVIEHGLGSLVRLAGWRIEGTIPPIDKGVLIFVPHTSNWDFVVSMPLLLSQGIELSWIGKHTLFQVPVLGRALRALGGVPVERHKRQDLVEQLAGMLAAAPRMVLGLAPEGTRSRAEHWKSGFYHIALAAGVPIYPGYLDYRRKVGGVGPALHPSGDIRRDMDRLRGFYAGVTARYPEHFGPVRLREEDAAPAPPAS
jgi:1-acyl-sn-glycerol-3-phosphate acyltransferase